MQKRNLVKIVAAFLLAALIIGLCGCFLTKSDEDLIRSRIAEFVRCYNSGDMSGALACCSAKTRNALAAVVSLLEQAGGSLLGAKVKMSDLFSVSVGAMSDGDMLQVDVDSISVNGDRATAKATMRYKDVRTAQSAQLVVALCKEGNDWYIEDMHD